MMGKLQDLDHFTAERLLRDEPVDLDSVSALSPNFRRCWPRPPDRRLPGRTPGTSQPR
jgi:hypothetical protein